MYRKTTAVPVRVLAAKRRASSVSGNARAWYEFLTLRTCNMAQWEIRQLFKQIRHEIFRVSPFFGSFLAPKCVPLGYCDEMGNRDEHCRIRPHRDTVMLEDIVRQAGAPR